MNYTTPAIMLALLIGPYLAARVLSRTTRRRFDTELAGAIGGGLLFAFTGVGHFLKTAGMAQMLPPWVPARVPLVYASGVLELLVALGLFLPATRRLAGRVAALLLVAFFPANVWAAMNYVPFGGHVLGPPYLWVRGPLQIEILAWIYVFTLRKPRNDQTPTDTGSERAPEVSA